MLTPIKLTNCQVYHADLWLNPFNYGSKRDYFNCRSVAIVVLAPRVLNAIDNGRVRRNLAASSRLVAA